MSVQRVVQEALVHVQTWPQTARGMSRCCRCDNITISPALLGQLEACKDPLPRKLWPKMGGCSEPHLDLHAEKKDLFDKMHGEDQMAVDKLREGIEGGSCC